MTFAELGVHHARRRVNCYSVTDPPDARRSSTTNEIWRYAADIPVASGSLAASGRSRHRVAAGDALPRQIVSERVIGHGVEIWRCTTLIAAQEERLSVDRPDVPPCTATGRDRSGRPNQRVFKRGDRAAV
jgi:hypothetical protein